MRQSRRKGCKLFLLGLILGLSSCLSPGGLSNKTRDATNDPAWWGELAKGEVLQLNQDALLSNGGLNVGAWIVTGAYGAGEKVTVEQYKLNPVRYLPYSISLLPRGTRLRCIRLERFFSSEYRQYKVYAEILDGEHKGKLTNVLVTGDPNRKHTLRLNAEFLEPLK